MLGNSKRRWVGFAFLLGLVLVLGLGAGSRSLDPAGAQSVPSIRETAKQSIQSILKPPSKATAPQRAPDSDAPEAVAAGDAPSKLPKRPGTSELEAGERPIEMFLKDTKKIDGLITLYRHEKTGRLLAEIEPGQLNRSYLMAMTLESAIGEAGLYSGLPLGDFLFTFRKVNNTLQLVIPNTYFRATAGTPMQRSVQRSFSDSVVETLPIRSTRRSGKEERGYLVDLTPVLVGDLPGLGAALGSSYSLEAARSYISKAKGFPLNLEIESVLGFGGGGERSGQMAAVLNALPDSRAFDLHVHYSLSLLPEKNGYRPRLADDRVGYFITAFQDFNDDTPRQPFVRYINRWNLEKKDPNAALSEPKQPIVFWIENTVPKEYRSAVQEGILMWNRAFEKIGFKDAIVAKQMPDRADWDPADIRYNTIRWFNSSDAIFAMGPSRVNPITGEILDADVMVDANFVRSLKQEYRAIIEQNQASTLPLVAQLTGSSNLCNYGSVGRSQQQTETAPPIRRLRFQSSPIGLQDLCLGTEAAEQFSVGQMSLALLQNALPSSPEVKDFIQQFLRELIAHEVGHTLGLRHNFHASAMLKPEELNNLAITRQKGLVASVMDYASVNLAPQGTKQGEYFTSVVGPYDEWAIAYGYTPSDVKTNSTANPPANFPNIAQTTLGERDLLQKIASRAPEPDLAYATDEDVFSFLDPKVNLFDLSSDLLTYSQWQLDNAQTMWKRIDQRYPLQGESFNDVSVAFNAVFNYYVQYTSFLTHYVGGQSFNRYRYGDAKGRLPFEPVPLADQRQALKILQKTVFDEKNFQFSADFINKLAPSRWEHWGTNPARLRLDYPISEKVLFLQQATLYDLMSYRRLARLRDGEAKNAPDQTLTIPELFDTLQTTIWGEVLNPGLNPSGEVRLSSLRRALQREHMNLLTAMVLRKTNAPEDARTVARYELKQLRQGIDGAIRKVNKKDIYTLAHLEESRDRLSKAIDAPLQSQ
jgi:Met-zincin/Domain of unknown function (DUF5117)